MRLAEDMRTLREVFLPEQFVPTKHGPSWYLESGGLRRRLTVAAEVADVIASLHSRGLCYVDINPNNAMVSRDSHRSETWLIDADNLTSLTRPQWDIRGFPGYMAPERMVRLAPPTTLADAYALGVLAFRMLVLTHPLRGQLTDEMDGGTADRMIDRGELPYVADEGDPTNRLPKSLAAKLLPIVLSGRIKNLCAETFGPGRIDPTLRPGASRWRAVLFAALDNVVECAAGCGWTYYRNTASCPQCDAPGTSPHVVTIYGSDYEQPGEARDSFAVHRERPTAVLSRHLWGRYEEREPVLVLRPASGGFEVDAASGVAVLDSAGKSTAFLTAPPPGKRIQVLVRTAERPDRVLRLRGQAVA
jgi:serine/threonine protein kinase